MAKGDSRFLRRVLTAYGYTSGQLDRDFRQRLLAWAILHRHSISLPGCSGCRDQVADTRLAR